MIMLLEICDLRCKTKMLLENESAKIALNRLPQFHGVLTPYDPYETVSKHHKNKHSYDV